MTPGARCQAAIEILDAVSAETAPADLVVGAYMRGRRYIGAKDRPAIAETVYGVLRLRAQLDWWMARVARSAADAPAARQRVLAFLTLVERWPAERIEAAFDGDRFRPAALAQDEHRAVAALAKRTIDHPDQPPSVRWNIPAWIEPELAARYGADFAAEMAALSGPAGVDLRANTLKTDRQAAARALAEAGIETRPTPWSPWGLRSAKRATLAATAPYRDGLVEIQDEGSQIAALLVDARPGMRVCDFCAGAGGKALAMAAAMRNKGHIVACEVSTRRLQGAAKRLRRAGVHNVEPRPLVNENDPWVKRHSGGFDRVLVDAPCTGSGTWRRNPDAKWTLTETAVAELADRQRRILDSAARLTKPGGRLIYVTCSILSEENEGQVERFLETHPDYALVPAAEIWRSVLKAEPPGDEPCLRLTPARHGVDGFFVAVFERRAAAGAKSESC